MAEVPKVRQAHIALHLMEGGNAILFPVDDITVMEAPNGRAVVFIPGVSIGQMMRESFQQVAAQMGIANIPAAPPPPLVMQPDQPPGLIFPSGPAN